MAESGDVAEWMLTQVRERTQWYQEDAVAEIADRFGNDFVYENENGNPAIDRRVLRAFRKISEDMTVWDREDRAWRLRSPGDAPGRQQG